MERVSAWSILRDGRERARPPEDEVRWVSSANDLTERALIERFDLENGGVVVVAGPEGHRRSGVVDENAANIGLARQQILDRLSGLRVKPQHAVVRHRAAPQFAMPIEIDVAGI